MGPAELIFGITFENGVYKRVTVHISKDQDEIDGLIMAARHAGTLKRDIYAPVINIERVTK